MARKKESYEEKISKLTDIVDVMENSQLTLEESMKKYEEGIKLCNDLYKILNDYEGKIKILSGDNEEEFNIE
ncbi:exodeoxyribonuclease VII small subunit [Clostridium senegalense]|uniref:Exodeoxyribonuclease 7 small subunit n=1 Tax=Clostridium senegalense TaxID=1465809 RepID=A0A6M0H0E4_9CLOT|nr:exodeoxyribonuclease VII small subunit [Clostridium senegalense]NEU03584.1 exodeoxyribonuclease VII small subunit [Clostridium senegalense]